MRSRYQRLMQLALEEAERAAAAGEVPVGAIVALGDEVVSRAHNEVEARRDATAHAEMLAIRRASKALGRWRLDDAQLIVTLEPCPMCIGAILLSRLAGLCFGCYDPKQGAVGSLFDLSNHPGMPQRVAVVPEVLEGRCSSVLQHFFAERRSEKRQPK